MPDQPLQNSLFEDDYLLRELGQVAHVPQVALTELVANAWDAGATRVDLILPAEICGTLTVTDNGHGMTPAQFKKRWMTLRYDRLKHQGPNVEFPSGRHARPRRAYGRNGIGRHGLLCFADKYEVQTWCDAVLATFVVGTESGPSPFVLRSETLGQRNGSGTQLSVRVMCKLPDAEEILTVLAARFVHDPEFEVRVNGVQRSFNEIEGRVSEEVLDLGAGRSATVIVIDSTQLNHSSVHQGIAFWVQRRLVGSPSWSIGQIASFDGRTRFARRYKVIVDTEGFEPGVDVAEDWTAFRATDAVRDLYRATAEHVGKVAQDLAAEIVEAASEDALVQNRTELASLGQGARLEVAEFTKVVAQAHPTISPDFLATAVKAVIIFMQCGPIRHTAARPVGAPHDLEVVPRSRFARIDLPTTAGIQDVFRHLANDLARTEAIAAEAAAAFEQGRKVLVLTERTEHLEAIRQALIAQAPAPFVLHGRMSKKQRAALITEMETLPPEAPRILLATGKLIGEGFDHPPLDTLVLAMPVSWKGTLQQYAGRLHREHASKADVRIIDFVDTGHPALLRMWEKRQRGYRAMGYRVGLDASSGHASMEDVEVPGFVPSEQLFSCGLAANWEVMIEYVISSHGVS